MRSDLISRQAAIKEVEERLKSAYVWYDNSVLKDDYALSVRAEGAISSFIECVLMLKELPSAEPRWIPCSERLPEPDEYYLVTKRFFRWNCKEYREIDLAKYDFDGWHKADTILAWMPLPEPYKEEQE